MTSLEKREQLSRQLHDRKEYDEFLSWVDNHSPDSYMTFKEWQLAKYESVMLDAEVVWNGEDPGAA